MYIKLSKENREEMIRSLQNYFYEERSEEIGNLAAENMLDFIIEEIGPFIYNEGVKDAKKVVTEKLLNLEEDILALERPVDK